MQSWAGDEARSRLCAGFTAVIGSDGLCVTSSSPNFCSICRFLRHAPGLKGRGWNIMRRIFCLLLVTSSMLGCGEDPVGEEPGPPPKVVDATVKEGASIPSNAIIIMTFDKKMGSVHNSTTAEGKRHGCSSPIHRRGSRRCHGPFGVISPRARIH
jgi:hypothetical protein